MKTGEQRQGEGQWFGSAMTSMPKGNEDLFQEDYVKSP